MKLGIQGINVPKTKPSIEDRNQGEVEKFNTIMADEMIADRIFNDSDFKEFYTQYKDDIVASSTEDKALIASSTMEEIQVALDLKRVSNIITEMKVIDPEVTTKAEIYRIKEELKSIQNKCAVVQEKKKIAWGLLDEVKPKWLQDYEDRRNMNRIEMSKRASLSVCDQIKTSGENKGLIGEALISATD